jgi:hypothetical protein
MPTGWSSQVATRFLERWNPMLVVLRLSASLRRRGRVSPRHSRLAVLTFLLVVGSATACVRPGGTPSPEDEEAMLPVGPISAGVENLSQYNVTIYVVRGSLRRRVGEVAPLSKAEMQVPDMFTNDHGGFNLQVQVVGGPARYVSDTVAPQRGERLVLTVQNRIVNSSLMVQQP